MKNEELCSTVDSRIRPEVETLAKQVQSIASKLEEARKSMAKEPLIAKYDNGGGQKGTRENPYYAAYEKLLGSYLKSLTLLCDLLGDREPSVVDALEDLRNKFRVS